MKLRNLLQRIAKKLRVAACLGATLLPGVAILGGGLSFVGQASAVELVSNGGFEMNNGFNGDNSAFGWTTVAGSDTTLGFDVYSHTTQVYYDGAAPAGAGEWYFHTVGLGLLPDTPAVVEQEIDVTGLDGSPYTFSAYIAGFSAGSGDTAQLELEFDVSGVVNTLDGLTGGSDGITNTWDLFSENGVIPAGASTATVRILQATISANGNDNYVDLVSLNVVPEPSALALLGLGGVLVAGLRRGRRE